MNYTNIIIEFTQALGMSPSGVMLGFMGSVMAILYKVNSFNWKGSFVILLSGATLSGYGMPVFAENLSIGKGTSFFLLFLVGFLAPEVFTQLKRFAPGALKLLGTRVKKIIHKDSSTNDK